MTQTFLPTSNPNDVLTGLFLNTSVKIEGKIKETDKICRKVLSMLFAKNIKNVSYNITKGEITIN